jgi:hypothetical protein
MTTLQQSEREWIRSIRGKHIQKVVAVAEDQLNLYEVVGFGFENYPEPQFYFLRLNGVDVFEKSGKLLTSYWDDELIYTIYSITIQNELFASIKEESNQW